MTKAVTQWMQAHSKYNVIITNYLMEKSFASDYTVFTILMDSMVHQEHKEALLGYFHLWQLQSQTLSDLDEDVERCGGASLINTLELL